MKSGFQLLDVSSSSSDSLSGLSDSSRPNFNSVNLNSLGKNLVYNEMADFPVRRRTEIETLQENMMVLSELNDRLSFLSKEIKYLLNLK